MRGKEFFISMLTTYFTLVTLITVAMLILGLHFDADATFGYEAFLVPLVYGACGVIPMGIMYSTRELTIKEVIVRKVIQFLLIEIIILFVAFYGREMDAKQIKFMLLMGVSILVIYVLAHVIDWIQNCVSAKRMTKQLVRLQENVK